jgi:hypothetical protein
MSNIPNIKLIYIYILVKHFIYNFMGRVGYDIYLLPVAHEECATGISPCLLRVFPVNPTP